MAATAVVPEPRKGSRTTSFANVYSSMNRFGSETGKGAGWPIFEALSGCRSHTESVASRNSSFEIVLSPLRTRSQRPFEKQRQYSWRSRKIGFLADCHEPQAVDPLA